MNAIVCALLFCMAGLLAWPLGIYMDKVYKGHKSLLDFFGQAEKIIFRLCGIQPEQSMNWKQYLLALISINTVWLIYGFCILIFQGSLFLNPAKIPSMEWSLAFNSAISFLTSTNLQHYSGESSASYLSQMGVFMFLQFVSAATSLAAGVAVLRGLVKNGTNGLGNFYSDFVKSLTRILLPLCLVVAIIFVLDGMPMTFSAPDKISSLQGDSLIVARGPVAAMIPIKELGSNGGGFFGTNDAHPFENPGFFTFCVHSIIIFLLPMAFVFFIGRFLDQPKFGKMLFLVMSIGFVSTTWPIIKQEVKGNPAICTLGISQPSGNMEGKETRFGSFYSAFFSGENVIIPAGAITGMHDSYLPLSGITMIISMQTDVFFGGLGSGWINMFIYLIIAIFIGTLMIGRTPEIFGKKIEQPEMQTAVGIGVIQTMVPLGLAAISFYIYTHYPGGNEALGWLSNKKAHGFTTILYEFISCMAGNGSEFSGLGNNTVFWNLSTVPAMLFGRFLPIAGALYIAALLKVKIYTPPSKGSLQIGSVTFGIFLFVIIIMLSALSLFPALMLGPVNEQHMIIP